jgi:hypothetical protein
MVRQARIKYDALFERVWYETCHEMTAGSSGAAATARMVKKLPESFS